MRDWNKSLPAIAGAPTAPAPAGAGTTPLASLDPLWNELWAYSVALSLIGGGLETEDPDCRPAWAASLRACVGPIIEAAEDVARRAGQRHATFRPGPCQGRAIKRFVLQIAELELWIARVRHALARLEADARSR
jgi:hypothetical protein